jgi:hypothetical protein
MVVALRHAGHHTLSSTFLWIGCGIFSQMRCAGAVKVGWLASTMIFFSFWFFSGGPGFLALILP